MGSVKMTTARVLLTSMVVCFDVLLVALGAVSETFATVMESYDDIATGVESLRIVLVLRVLRLLRSAHTQNGAILGSTLEVYAVIFGSTSTISPRLHSSL